MFRQTVVLISILKICHGVLILNPNEIKFEDLDLENDLRAPYPDAKDWRQSGCVTGVKDQRRCEACWAFAIVGTLESLACIHLDKKVILSEQFLIDCLPSTAGCGLMSLFDAYLGLTQLGGVLSNKDYYPFEERQRPCRWRLSSSFHEMMGSRDLKRAKPSVLVTAVKRLDPYDEDMMARVIAQYGPITAAINPESMINYPEQANYIDEPEDGDCDPRATSHTVTIVGYDYTTNEDGEIVKYWIIKNSWSTKFGDQGYYYLVRGRNACGIASDTYLPIVSG